MTKMDYDQEIPAEDITWVQMTKAGERTAFTSLVERYQHPIYNLCYRMLNDPAAAEDATQETFLRAFLKLDAYDPTRRFSSWLYAIASHYCLDQLKRVQPQLVSWEKVSTWSSGLAQSGRQPETVLLMAEATSDIQTWLSVLSSQERVAIILKYWHKRSCEEIAQTLDTSTSAIKSKLFRARKKIALAAVNAEKDTPQHNLRPSQVIAFTS